MKPLQDVKIVDFSAQLPGPLASLILAEAGAQVVRVEPPKGEMLRSYPPIVDGESVNFAMLNRGKRSVALDLKDPTSIAQLTPLLREADVVIEQFRPGAMHRLGLDYLSLTKIKRDIIYCSITGYGQSGPKSLVAGHDLNYCADTGLLAMSRGPDGAPTVPAALVADIGGGAYPAVMNILLALRARDRTGEGSYIDVSMSDNLFAFMYWASARGFASGQWPTPSGDILTGASPRYGIYRTQDDRFVAVAALEQKFWEALCDILEVEERFKNEAGCEEEARSAVAEAIRGRDSSAWRRAFVGKDVCSNVVATLEEAVNDAHYRSRGLFDRHLVLKGGSVPALPVPISTNWSRNATMGFPQLGEGNAEFLTRDSGL